MEMALDGWKFLVLSPAFAIHWGFQERNQQNKMRKMQVNKNRQRFNAFEREVRAKYAAKNNKGASLPFNASNKKDIYPKVSSKLSTNRNTKHKSKKKGKENVIVQYTTKQTKTKMLKYPKTTHKPLFYESDFAGPKFDDGMSV